MAHGKHRRTRRPQRNDLRLKPAAERAQLVEQQHMVSDGDDTEQVFNLMACVHPATCTCETDYPNWKPGQR